MSLQTETFEQLVKRLAIEYRKPIGESGATWFDELGFAQAICGTLKEIVEEQKHTIAALNVSLGGEGSTSTENIVKVSRMEVENAELRHELEEAQAALDNLGVTPAEAKAGLKRFKEREQLIAAQAATIELLRQQLAEKDDENRLLPQFVCST